MKRNRSTDEQIIGILKAHEAGTPVSELCRKHGVSDAGIYKWKAIFSRPASDISMPGTGETMTRRPRRNHSPAFNAKVALAAISMGGKRA
jgi:transposase-like protein